MVRKSNFKFKDLRTVISDNIVQILITNVIYINVRVIVKLFKIMMEQSKKKLGSQC